MHVQPMTETARGAAASTSPPPFSVRLRKMAHQSVKSAAGPTQGFNFVLAKSETLGILDFESKLPSSEKAEMLIS
jgi:hypothetical protein